MSDESIRSVLLDQQAQDGARAIAELSGRDHHDLFVVLGSGLAHALDAVIDAPDSQCRSFALSDIPGVEAPVADGHVNTIHSVRVGALNVLIALGRTHLYEGVSPACVTACSRAAAATGVHTALLCNANGCVRQWQLGDVMAIDDHLNFSGYSPFNGPIFVDVTSVWNRELTDTLAQHCQRRGIYACMRGPEYQTLAEGRWLMSTGADCVGMSTVMEAITLHALGVHVCGMSVVSDLSFADAPTDPNAVVEAAAAASTTIESGFRAICSHE